MTLNRDDELLSYFPKRSKRELNAEDIHDIDGERLMQRDSTWDTLGKYQLEKDNAGITFPWESEEAPELEYELAGKEEKEDKKDDEW